MKLSIVVPVYNVERYLPKCLDSLLNQDIDKNDYEIIIVNDGSTDKSRDIAKEYSLNYSNIILINQENRGLSSARNTGIKHSKGKYIQFVDSDDFLEPNVEKTLIDKIEKDNLDVLRFNYRNVNEKYDVFEPNKSGRPFVDYTDNICDGVSFLTERLGFACYAWQFILKTELVISIPLFKEGIFFEDTEWTPRVLSIADRVTSVDTFVYNYLVRDGSITRAATSDKKRKIIDDKLSLIGSLTHQMDSVCDKRWYQGIISSTAISLLGCVAEDFFAERNIFIKKLRYMGIFPLCDYHLNKYLLRKRTLINFSPEIFCLIYYLKNGCMIKSERQ